MNTKILTAIFVILTLALVLVGQQPVEVRRITAPATGTKTAANSDSIVCATDTGCIMGAAGGVVTNNSTTYSAKVAPDANLLGTLGTAFTTAGFVDIKGADGNVFVRNATAGNFLANVTLQTQTDTVMVGGVNEKEINGVAPLMDNGASGTGAQRISISNNNSAIANWGHGATGSAVPSGSTYFGSNQGGNLSGIITCNNYIFDRSSTADVSLVAISGSTSIYVCGYRISGEATTASDVSLEYGTGATCGTGTNNLTPPTTLGTSTSGAMIGGVAVPPGVWSGLKTPASQRLCVHRSAAQTSEVEVWYTQF